MKKDGGPDSAFTHICVCSFCRLTHLQVFHTWLILMQDPSYPRPQLRRREWTSLNGTWRFAFDDTMRHRVPANVDQWPLEIEVPFAPECARSGLADTGFHRACWYQREFDVPPAMMLQGRHVLLHFGA